MTFRPDAVPKPEADAMSVIMDLMQNHLDEKPAAEFAQMEGSAIRSEINPVVNGLFS